mmetsp:Transcript_108744/g.318149  ORF Transcript_108744/g.318149 Transcript_108744/m.318149 type:complete len:317 (-) Transcript_108744:497-1447(-)
MDGILCHSVHDDLVFGAQHPRHAFPFTLRFQAAPLANGSESCITSGVKDVLISLQFRICKHQVHRIVHHSSEDKLVIARITLDGGENDLAVGPQFRSGGHKSLALHPRNSKYEFPVGHHVWSRTLQGMLAMVLFPCSSQHNLSVCPNLWMHVLQSPCVPLHNCEHKFLVGPHLWGRKLQGDLAIACFAYSGNQHIPVGLNLSFRVFQSPRVSLHGRTNELAIFPQPRRRMEGMRVPPVCAHGSKEHLTVRSPVPKINEASALQGSEHHFAVSQEVSARVLKHAGVLHDGQDKLAITPQLRSCKIQYLVALPVQGCE